MIVSTREIKCSECEMILDEGDDYVYCSTHQKVFHDGDCKGTHLVEEHQLHFTQAELSNGKVVDYETGKELELADD